MFRWQYIVMTVIICVKCDELSKHGELALISSRNLMVLLPEFLGRKKGTTLFPTAEVAVLTTEETGGILRLFGSDEMMKDSVADSSTVSEEKQDGHSVVHAGVPRSLGVVPIALEGSDHELKFNVSWMRSLGPPARDYSIEVMSETRTTDCDMPLCYDYNIPGDTLWWVIPAQASPVAESCALRPGCAYRVRLFAHPWDGHTSANLLAQLDECVAGVCSCAHAPRLPQPRVQARVVSVQGELLANVSWTLPPPDQPQRLPPDIQIRGYYVSIGKQMVSDAHPAPWYAHIVTRKVPSAGPIATGDTVRWVLLRIVQKGPEAKQRTEQLGVKLVARVSLVDERECVGPAGNTTAYDPADSKKGSIATYVVWAALGGACALAAAAALALGAGAVKRVLQSLRAPSPPPLAPLRPGCLPLLHRASGIDALHALVSGARSRHVRARGTCSSGGCPRRQTYSSGTH